MNIYQEEILDHFQNPQNFGYLSDFDFEASLENPLCGDKIKIQVKLDKDIIRDIKFSGQGCAISLATASMLTEEIKNKSISQVNHLTKDNITKLLNIELGPTRLKCALLSLETIKKALAKK
ncbi:MAG TPA: SUF system NifU family Fe-S cluster assembly protein [Patescibacteria group bacterium]